MSVPASPDEQRVKRETFFKLVFGSEADGYICISHKPAGGKWQDDFFHYPNELPRMLHHIEQVYKTGNTYFCPQLLASKDRLPGTRSARTKENVKTCTTAWADLDSCDPKLMLVEPSIVVMTSSNRYQALWVFDHPVDPVAAEQISKNIAYHHVPDGADSSGWDLTQALRVPYTYNMKYALPVEIVLERVTREVYHLEDFQKYAEVRTSKYDQDPMPEVLTPEPALDIMQRYRKSLNPITFSIFSVEPSNTPEEGGWSKVLWHEKKCS